MEFPAFFPSNVGRRGPHDQANHPPYRVAKPASTSRQRGFAENRPFLREHGIDDPSPDRRGAFGQHHMIRSVIAGDVAAADAFFDAFPDHERQLNDLLLSAILGHRRWKASV